MKLVQSFERRLCNSKFYEYTGDFIINAEIDNVAFNIEKGKISVTDNFITGVEVNIPINILHIL